MPTSDTSEIYGFFNYVGPIYKWVRGDRFNIARKGRH